MENTSILAAFERLWQHVVIALGAKSNTDHVHDDRYYTEAEVDTKLSGKSDVGHAHDDRYYTEDEIDGMEFITIDDVDAMEFITAADIDAICNQNFQSIENLTDEIDQYASLNDELEAVVDEMSGSIVE